MERDYKLYVHISPSGKRYYGITKQKPSKRWKNGKAYKKNKYFTNAINKYGWDSFTHEVLFNNLTEAEAKLLEQCYIALYDTTSQDKGYNITLGGESANGLKHTEEWKQSHSKRMSGKNNPMCDIHICGENHYNYGKHPTKETRQKMSESRKGEKNYMYGKHHTEKARKKISEAKKGKNNPGARAVICLTTGRMFFTAKEAAEYYDIDSSSIIKRCRGKGNYCGKLPDGTKLVWRYLNYKHNKTYRVINKEVA